MSTTLTLAGFGRVEANGVYALVTTDSADTIYQKGNFYIIQKGSLMPYSDAAGYFLIQRFQLGNETQPLDEAIYMTAFNDVVANIAAAVWTTCLAVTSGEQHIGTVTSN